MNPVKHAFAASMALLATPLAASQAGDAPPRSALPNVVFILADDLGWADTTLYGHTKFHRTPNVERLAKRGTTFTRAYSASPLCSPTRSAIVTGLSPARTGITVPNGHVPQVVLAATQGKRAPPEQQAVMPNAATRLKTEYRTLAEALKDAGYATGHFGKWHLGAEPYSPLQHGFDVDVPHHPGPGPAGSYVAPWRFKNFAERTPGEHIEDRMAAEAVAWIEANRDRPFYLNYWMFSVHAPFDAKRTNIEKHRLRLDPADPQRSPTYAAMIESMDDAVGTLLDALDRLKLSENTIVVFTSDNGGNMYSQVDGAVPTSNAPLRGGKATMFEGGTRVPAIVVWPSLAAPDSRSDATIQSEDFYPTLLDGLGLRPAEGQRFDGVSIVPALKGGALARDAVFQYFPHSPAVPDWLPPSASVHRGDWKLIRIFHGGERGAHRHLLFDLRNDLGETRNLAARMPKLVAELDAMIEAFLADTKAVVPVPNPAFDPTRYRPELEGIPAQRSRPKDGATARGGSQRDDDPALQGWKARGCTAVVERGVLTVKANGAEPFLGFAPGKLDEGATLRFRIKCGGGAGKVAWLETPRTKPADAPIPVEFLVKAGAWAEIGAKIPAPKGKPGIVRLFVPAGSEPVEVDWIELTSGGKTRRWDF